MQRRWRRRLKAGATLAGACLAVAMVTIWLMFQHIPAWYQPPAIGPQELRAIHDDLKGTVDQLTGYLINSPEAFERRFTQEQINQWLSAREAIWPLSRKWLPEMLTNPFVSIEPDGIRLATTFRKGGLQSVLNARFTAEVSPRGIELRLVKVALGSLPVPSFVVRDQLDRLDEQLKAGAGDNGSAKEGLAGLFRGIVLPNKYVWPNGKKPFRIIGLRFESGTCIATFEPLEDDHARR